MTIRTMLAATLMALVVGCANQPTFEVLINNRLTEPLSVGMIKSGLPLEEGWDAPEQIATLAPELMDKRWGKMVPPLSTLKLGPQKGTFDGRAMPYLRVYFGDKKISELIATNQATGLRLDVPLEPGKSEFNVELHRGFLKVTLVASQAPKP